MSSTILKCCIIFHAVSNVVFAADDKGCFHPGQRLHTKAIMSQEDEDGVYPVNTTISYISDPGYQLLDNESRRCLDDGSWSGSEPYCGVNVGGSANVSTSPNLVTIALRDSYEECIQVDTSETTFNIEFNKDYNIDLLKLTFQVYESQVQSVPNVTYDISTLDTKVWNENAVLLKHYSEPSNSKTNVVFQYAFDKSSPARNFSLKIGWPKDNFVLCGIALYSTSAIPQTWCQFDDEVDSDTLKHLLYEDRCYVVIGSPINFTTGTEINHLCRDYRRSYNSTLVADNNGLFQYIDDSLKNTPLSDSRYYWISYMNMPDRCGRIYLRKIKKRRKDDEDCDTDHGRICQYDIPQCGTPDQRNGTLMRFKGSTMVTYSCPVNNFELEGSVNRTCSKGQWSPDAPTCIHVPSTTTSEVVSSTEATTSVTSKLSCTTDTETKDSCDSQYDAIYTRIIKITCIVVAVFVILICLTTGLALVYIKYYL